MTRLEVGYPARSGSDLRAGLARPSIPDLIIAATAELTGLAVLHVEKDFEIIASITGQPLERLNAN